MARGDRGYWANPSVIPGWVTRADPDYGGNWAQYGGSPGWVTRRDGDYSGNWANPNVIPAWVRRGEPKSGDKDDVAMANLFAVRLQGPVQTLGTWAQVSGLSVNWASAEYRAGDAGNHRWYSPGITTYSNVVLKRAACPESELVKKWLSQTSFKHNSSRDGEIILYAPGYKKIMSWELRRIMPIKWTIDGFEASGSKVAIETIELAHEGFLNDHYAAG